MRELGINVSEFPVTMESAWAAKERTIWTVFGSPNVLRGGSQCGSMRAIDAIIEGAADCLCSDYSPGTLVPAVFRINRTTDITLHEATRLVTVNPAKVAGPEDRGEIVPGKRTDLIALHLKNDLPQVTSLWVKGRPVFRVAFNHG